VALKPTIYKLRIALSDLERNYYDSFSLTVALHPSETPERMVARVMAFCLNAQQDLCFTKGLSDVEEPDLWLRTMEEKTLLWIDVGEPDAERVKKSTRKAERVKIYSFNSKTDTWWQQGKGKFSLFDAEFTRFEPSSIVRLASLLQRTVDWSVTITGQSAYVASSLGETEITWQTLQSFRDS